MTSITIAHTSCWQVEYTNEERDEHIRLVHVGHRGIQCGNNTIGHRLMGRDRTEYRTGDSHEERRRYTLT